MKRIILFSIVFCINSYLIAQNGSGVVINEFMAQNNAFITDENGQYEDWIEFYNNNNHSVDLSGFYLSDNGMVPNKWQFPSGTIIEAHGYLIVWADEDLTEGPLHADFKLSAAGEEIVFSNSDLVEIDYTSFGQQTANMGCARVPNGTGNFVIQAPTFATNNEGILSIPALDQQLGWEVYPNPASDFVVLNFDGPFVNSEVKVLDLSGKVVLDFVVDGNQFTLPLENLNSGTYIIQHEMQQKKLIVIK